MTANPQRSVARLAVLLLTAALGCASAAPVTRYTFVTRTPRLVQPQLLERGVRGEYCFTRNLIRVLATPPWRSRLADPGAAVADALSRVPGANILTHVSVQTRVEQYLLFQRTCAIVVGNAGYIE